MCEYQMDMDKRPKGSSQGPIYLVSGLMNCIGMHYSTLNMIFSVRYTK
jgi:hypothetical protein